LIKNKKIATVFRGDFFDIKKNCAIVAWFGKGLPMSKNVIPTERSE